MANTITLYNDYYYLCNVVPVFPLPVFLLVMKPGSLFLLVYIFSNIINISIRFNFEKRIPAISGNT